MFSDVPFYHGVIRNTVVAFADMFNNIRFERRDNANAVIQTIRVPIAYSQKEKWVHSIEANPDTKGERGIYAAFPRMGFEVTGYSYDPARKLPRMGRVGCSDEEGRVFVRTPVPYNIEMSLYFVTKTQEDALQILEQILPTFSPEYTMAVRTIPELNIIDEVPFILNSVSVQDDYEGDLETRRFVIHTLTFTAKVNLYSGVSNTGLIKQVEANLPNQGIGYVASQETPDGPITENWVNLDLF